MLSEQIAIDVDTVDRAEKKKRELRTEAIQKVALCLAIINLFIVVSAKDIAMLAITAQYECALNTEFELVHARFTLSTWMYVAAVSNMIVLVPLVVWIRLIAETSGINYRALGWRMRNCAHWVNLCGLCCLAVYVLPLTIIGFLFNEEIKTYGANHTQCADVVLAWLILQMLLVYTPFCGWLWWCCAKNYC